MIAPATPTDYLGAQISWPCRICREVRPDAKVAVVTRPSLGVLDLPVQVNVRHCVDRPACLAGAEQLADQLIAKLINPPPK